MDVEGKELRDEFAIQILNGWCSSRGMWSALCKDRREEQPNSYLAKEAYRLADAMMSVRSPLKKI